MYKDKDKQKANQHCWYIANRELTLARTKARKKRLREEKKTANESKVSAT